MSRLPDFFIIGAPQWGTISLANWLRRQPVIHAFNRAS